MLLSLLLACPPVDDGPSLYATADHAPSLHPDDIEALQVLRDRALLDAYDIVFFNCGSAALSWVNGFPKVKQNLREWVLDGGSGDRRRLHRASAWTVVLWRRCHLLRRCR